jgi:hypothetical protein
MSLMKITLPPISLILRSSITERISQICQPISAISASASESDVMRLYGTAIDRSYYFVPIDKHQPTFGSMLRKNCVCQLF